jgi:hypothetical protein
MTTVVLSPTGDTYIDGNNATTNYGTATTMYINNYSPNPADQSLIKFDLSTLAGKSIVSATLGIYIDAGGANTCTLYRVLRAWTETGATYNKYDGTNNWGTAGCKNTSTDRSNTSLGSLVLSAGAGAYTCALDAAEFALLVASNNGFIIVPGGSADTNRQISTRENGTPANRPTLTVSYTDSGNRVLWI